MISLNSSVIVSGLAKRGQTEGLEGLLCPAPEPRPASSRPSTRPSDALPESLGRLESRLLELQSRFRWLVWIGIFGVLGLVFWVFLIWCFSPSQPVPWTHIQYPSGLELLVKTGGHAGALTLQVWQHPPVWILSLGLGLFVVIFILIAGDFWDPPAFITTPILSFLLLGAAFLSVSLLTVLLPNRQHLPLLQVGISRLERVQAALPVSSEEKLPLLWVEVQKQYFGTRTSAFSREVASLDRAYLAHRSSLPESATASRLWTLSEAAHLPGYAHRLQQERDKRLRQQQDVLEAGWAGFGFSALLLVFSGLPACFLRWRIGRLRRGWTALVGQAHRFSAS